MSENLKEFQKKWNKMGVDVPRDILRDEAIAKRYWIAALEWIYYKGVLDPSLAGDLIKDELDGSI